MADSKEEQARKARAFAEKCFVAGNIHGAKQWMLSALRLAPNLPGNAEAAAAYDVHAAAAGGKHLGAPEWYAVLGLPHPGSGAPPTREAIKKQHRKLCLLVHPDKNSSAAADGAFKLVQAAWEALSGSHPPPGASAAPAAAAPARRPPPPQAPPPRPPDPPLQRPHVVQMPRRAAPPPQRGRTSRVSPPLVSRRSPSPAAGKCRACGARTSNGKRSFRCLSCHWSPMDDDVDDYYGEDDYDYDF